MVVARRIAVESKSIRSCNHRLTDKVQSINCASENKLKKGKSWDRFVYDSAAITMHIVTDAKI